MGLNDEREKIRTAVDWIARSVVATITGVEGPTTEQVDASIEFLAKKDDVDAATLIADALQRSGPDEYPRGFYQLLAEEAMIA